MTTAPELTPERPVSPAATQEAKSQGTSVSPGEQLNGLANLLAEDLATYDSEWLHPGFLAVATHRVRKYAKHTPGLPGSVLALACRGAAQAIDWVWGIQIPEHVRLGRRVRIWHHGCVLLDAREIGDDVHFRHDTTLGPVRGSPATNLEALPVIENGADIGSGACILGPVKVGKSAVVGANTLVMKDVPAGATILGVPGRIIPS